MRNIKVACFDLDDTLIRGIHSVMLPCIINGKEIEHSIIQEKEELGLLNYREADYLRAKLLINLDEDKIKPHFLELVKPLRNIGKVVDKLHEMGMLCIVITVGPIQVARIVCDTWRFDECYGSDYEVVNGLFTGEINNYIKSEDKILCLKEFCNKNDIRSEECIAVGDGSTDIPIFEYCGQSIAINSCQKVKDKATFSVDTDDLMDILSYV